MTDSRSVSRAQQNITREVSWEHVNTGSLQRIADACEKMAASYDEIRIWRDRYKEWYEQEKRANRSLKLQIRSLRGVITRMKNRGPEGK